MATYNGADYLKPQIDSILCQLSENDELIISDDSSTDDTVRIIQGIDDQRIRLLEGSTFGSPVFNFEYALKQASGEFIFLADQDDLWLSGKIIKMTEILADCDLAVSDCQIIDENDKLTQPSFYAMRHSGPGLLKNLYKNTYLGCCMALRANVLEWALPFPKNIPMHDMWLGLVAEVFGQTRFCVEPLVQYRRHSQNLSPYVNQSQFSLSKKISFRIILIHHLLRRYSQLRSQL